MADIRITYESLFDLLRRERTREELQQLDPGFYHDVVKYLEIKAEMLESKSIDKGAESAKIQIKNIKKILKELYERRETKIINIAIDKSRSSGNIIDTTTLLPEEKDFFDKVTNLIMHYKGSILGNILEMKLPEVKAESKVTKPSPAKPEKQNDIEQQDYIMVRFVHPLPKFLGRNKEIFGPYDEEEIAKLPKYIADLLIKKERAEAIKA